MGLALVGITHYAQDQLGDVVYLELPAIGASVGHLAKMGEIESVKAVSDLYSPVSGDVMEVNARLAREPELVNNDPFGDGWMLRVKISDASELDTLLDAAAYEEVYRPALEPVDNQQTSPSLLRKNVTPYLIRGVAISSA